MGTRAKGGGGSGNAGAAQLTVCGCAQIFFVEAVDEDERVGNPFSV